MKTTFISKEAGLYCIKVICSILLVGYKKPGKWINLSAMRTPTIRAVFTSLPG